MIATARPGEEEAFVRGLGASDTIDYSAGDVAGAIRAKYPDGVTALIDTVNRGDAFGPMAALVRGGGRIATTLGEADVDALAGRNVRATNVVATPTPDKLTQLVEARRPVRFVSRCSAPIRSRRQARRSRHSAPGRSASWCW